MTDIIVIDPEDLERVGVDREFLATLGRVRAQVEEILEACPANRLEARRLFTGQLEIDPTPEELRTIGGVASRYSESGAVRDLAGSALASWVLAKRELKSVFDAKELESGEIARSAGRIPGLLELLGSVEDRVRSCANSSTPDDRKLLLQLGKMMAPVREPLLAAAVLAPRLERMALAIRDEELRSAFPSITDAESALFGGSSGNGTDDAVSSRVCVDAVALRTIILDDLSAWEEMQEGEADAKARDELRERLERDKLAYHVVSGRLQQQQDAALAADLRSSSEQLRRVRRGLFSAYLGLAPILKATTRAGAVEVADDEAPTISIEELIEESAATDQAADARQSEKSSTDKLYLNALEEMRDGKAPVATTRTVRRLDRKREKLRIGIMLSVAAALAVACFFAYGSMLRTKPTSLRLSVSDLPDKLALTNAMTVGPMMYAQVSHHSWDHLTAQERIARVNELGLNAVDQGIRTVYLTDEANVQVAIWTHSTGTTLPAGKPQP